MGILRVPLFFLKRNPQSSYHHLKVMGLFIRGHGIWRFWYALGEAGFTRMPCLFLEMFRVVCCSNMMLNKTARIFTMNLHLISPPNLRCTPWSCHANWSTFRPRSPLRESDEVHPNISLQWPTNYDTQATVDLLYSILLSICIGWGGHLIFCHGPTLPKIWCLW